jgi:hypothetical protein
MFKPSFILSFVIATTASQGAFVMSPMTTFGGGDGWRAPNETLTGDVAGTTTGSNYSYLGTGNLERGMSYNPVTKNLVVVSRSTAGNGIRVLNGSTGADQGALPQGSGIISGGTFTTNMVDIDSSGAIYVANLSTSATELLKVYQWASETATAPTTLVSTATGLGRAGDSFAVTGSGSGLVMAAAGNTATNASSFIGFTTTNGTSFTGTAYSSVAGTTTSSNDYRLSLSFVDSNTLIGTQGGSARQTDFGGSASVTGSIPLGATNRILDYAMVGGIPVLAVMNTNGANTPTVSLYDITTPNAPILLTSAATTSGTLTSNGNATGSIAWGEITATTATLYAMGSNQGIQAFNITFDPVPEPGVFGLLGGLGLVAMARRRR